MKFVIAFFTILLLASCSSRNPRVTISTTLGEIQLVLYTDKAPETAENFLDHIMKGSFENACFYRVVNENNQPDSRVLIDVIQGGLYEDSLVNKHPGIRHETTAETGILHKDGIISMARLEPGTASTEFFICVGDQPELDFGGNRNPDGQGFAAFGKVIKGMEIVRDIHSMDAPGQYLEKPIRITNISASSYLE